MRGPARPGAGAPERAPHQQRRRGIRHVFIEDGLVVLATRYHRGLTLSGDIRLVHRYLPREVGETPVLYLWLVLPLATCSSRPLSLSLLPSLATLFANFFHHRWSYLSNYCWAHPYYLPVHEQFVYDQRGNLSILVRV